MSYIKRKDAKNAILNYICEQTVSKYPSVAECKAAKSGAEGAFNEIDYIPTADVVEVRHGEWVEDERTYCGAGRCNYKCTVCGKLISAVRRDTTEHLYPYCPFCGAKMDGERIEE